MCFVPPEVPTTPPEPQPAPVEDRPLSSEEKVVAWRYLQLIGAGYDHDAALRLSVHPTVDLHVACELLERGCSLQQAVEILL